MIESIYIHTYKHIYISMICVCIYIYTRTHDVCVCMYVCLYVCLSVCLSVCMMDGWMHRCRMHACMYAGMQVCRYVYIYIMHTPPGILWDSPSISPFHQGTVGSRNPGVTRATAMIRVQKIRGSPVFFIKKRIPGMPSIWISPSKTYGKNIFHYNRRRTNHQKYGNNHQ